MTVSMLDLADKLTAYAHGLYSAAEAGMILEAAKALRRPAQPAPSPETAEVRFGFASFQGGKFELIVINIKTGEEVLLEGQLRPDQTLEQIDKVLPTCVYVNGHAQSSLPIVDEQLWGRFVNHYWDSLEWQKEIVLLHVKAVLDYHAAISSTPGAPPAQTTRPEHLCDCQVYCERQIGRKCIGLLAKGEPSVLTSTDSPAERQRRGLPPYEKPPLGTFSSDDPCREGHDWERVGETYICQCRRCGAPDYGDNDIPRSVTSKERGGE
jgi:hypothetical protein